MKKICLLLGMLIFLSSCGGTDTEVEVIPVNLNEAMEIDITSLSSIDNVCLKDTNIIGRLDNIIISDEFVLLKSGDNLKSFSPVSGEIIAKYSNKGRAENEYLSIWDIGYEDGLISLYDINSKKVMYFDVDGNLVRQIPAPQSAKERPFQILAKYNEDFYVGKRTFGVGDIAELAIYDLYMKWVRDIDGLTLRSGSKLGGSPFWKNDKDELLYIRSMLNDIYKVSETGIETIYTIDFGKHNVPGLSRFKDEVEIIEFVNNSSEGAYATFVHNIYESKLYFSFVFIFNGKLGYSIYNKKTKDTTSFFFEFPGLSLSQIYTYEDKAYLFWQSVDGKTQISVVPFSVLYNAAK